MAIADHLHKFVWEVQEQMSPEELALWVAWFDFKGEKEKASADRAERMSRSKRGVSKRPRTVRKRGKLWL